MRFMALLCLMATALHAQADPIYPDWPEAPYETSVILRGRVGYDTNVRLNDDRRDTSVYLDSGTELTFALPLPFGRFFCSAGAAGRLQWLYPKDSTWQVETRAGWADGDPWDKWYIGADIGLRAERRWVYEIYGLPTRDEDLHRGIFDFRTWGEVWVTGLRPRTIWWLGVYDYTEDLDDAYFDPSDIRPRGGQAPLPNASDDFFRWGGLFWAAFAPNQFIALGPYYWMDVSHFFEQRNVAPQDATPESRLTLQRYQVGSRLEFLFNVIRLEADVHIRAGETQGQETDEPLDYFQLGALLGVWLDFDVVAASVKLQSWIRYHELMFDATLIVPGGEYEVLDDTLSGGSLVIVELIGRPLPWIELGARYKWDEWVSTIPDYSYHRHDFSVSIGIRF